MKGLPISSYIDRVHVADQGILSSLISKAVRVGLSYTAEYRVANASKKWKLVMTVGRCFRDSTGNPLLYSRIIYPVMTFSRHLMMGQALHYVSQVVGVCRLSPR